MDPYEALKLLAQQSAHAKSSLTVSYYYRFGGFLKSWEWTQNHSILENSNPRISSSWKHVIRRTLLDFLYKSLLCVKIALYTVSLTDGWPDFFFFLFVNIQKEGVSTVSYSLMNFYKVNANGGKPGTRAKSRHHQHQCPSHNLQMPLVSHCPPP